MMYSMLLVSSEATGTMSAPIYLLGSERYYEAVSPDDFSLGGESQDHGAISGSHNHTCLFASASTHGVSKEGMLDLSCHILYLTLSRSNKHTTHMSKY